MIRRGRIAVGFAAAWVVAGSVTAPPACAQTSPPSRGADPPAVDRLPVTPVPVPAIVIVPSPPVAMPSPAAQPGEPPAAPAQPQVNEEGEQALALLADLQRYIADPPEDLKRELAGANAAFARTRSDANRIRMAMLLTLPAAGPPDDARALSLLEPLVGKTPNGSPLKQIASLLYAQIAERSRSLREEQRRTAAAQEKLDALRAVERSLLLERSRNAGGGSAGGGGGTGR